MQAKISYFVELNLQVASYYIFYQYQDIFDILIIWK